MTTITILDESTIGRRYTWNLEILDEVISLRELIRRRIYQEVTEHNARQSEVFSGLIQPTEAESTLNGYRLKNPHRLDWQTQYEKAIEAFTRYAYVVLVNDVLRQHQFNALAAARGWRNQLRLMVDDSYPLQRLIYLTRDYVPSSGLKVQVMSMELIRTKVVPSISTLTYRGS